MNSSATIRQFRHFVALAEARSFTRAASLCNLTQSALSRSIAALEQDLGATLVDRIGKRAELTAVGEAVLDHARHVVVDADELARCVSVHAQGESGRFRLGIGATPAALLNVEMLAFVANQFPRLQFSLSRGPVEEQVARLRERRLDALVVDLRSVLPTPDLHIDHLADLPAGLMCRPDHPLVRRGGQVRFDDLRAYPIASTHWSEEVVRRMVTAFGPGAHPDELIRLLCEDVASLLEVALRSDAVVLGVLACGRELIESGRLAALRLDVDGVDSRFGLVRLAGRSAPPFHERLRAFIAARFDAHRPLPVAPASTVAPAPSPARRAAKRRATARSGA